jgi:hypothetical protein
MKHALTLGYWKPRALCNCWFNASVIPTWRPYELAKCNNADTVALLTTMTDVFIVATGSRRSRLYDLRRNHGNLAVTHSLTHSLTHKPSILCTRKLQLTEITKQRIAGRHSLTHKPSVLCTRRLQLTEITKQRIERPGSHGLIFYTGKDIFVFTETSKQALWPTQSHAYRGRFFFGIKRPGSEDDHWPPRLPRSIMSGALPPFYVRFYSSILQSVLRQGHSVFQRELSRDFDIVVRFSIFNIRSLFLKVIQ